MKKITAFIAALSVAASIFTALPASADGDVTVRVNGSAVTMQVPPVIENGRTLVSLRSVSDALGCDIAWDAETRGITVTDGSKLTFAWIGKDTAFLTDAVKLCGYASMEVPPVIMNDYTMVPLRALSELFGAEVNWDDASRTVDITYTRPADDVTGIAEKFKSYEQALSGMYDAYLGYALKNGNVVNAEIQLENGGVIELELYPDIAPVSVANFVKLAESHFYDGLIFHRVIEGFMIQGGGFGTDYGYKKADNITGEFLVNGYFNLIHHARGVISMARAQDYNSGSSQFFIMHADTDSLDGQYAAFGRVTSGMEYVDAIAETPTEHNDTMNADDVPVQQQVIKTVVIK